MTDLPSSAASPASASPTPVRPPSTGGGTKALIAVLLSGTAVLLILGFVHFSNDGRIHPGASLAQAECTSGQRDCLPEVNYIDTAGVAYSRASLAGKVVLVNFWATWCHPCQTEIPDLSKVYDKYKAKGVVFLGVMSDNEPVESSALLNFQSDHDMRYPVVRLTSDQFSAYHYPGSLPTTFIFDRHGKQVFSQVGALRESQLEQLIAPLVAQN